jgi:hypothetical protein
MSEQTPNLASRASFSRPLPVEALLDERLQRIEGLHGQLRRGTIELLVAAYRLGLELKALRDDTPYREWNRLCLTRLVFVGKRRTINDYIALARAFRGEEALAGLGLAEAKRLARKILGGERKTAEKEKKKRVRKGEAGKCDEFIKYIQGGRLEKKAAQASLVECQSLRQSYTTIAMIMHRGVRACDKRLGSLRPRLVGSGNPVGQEQCDQALAGHLACGRMR